MTVSTSTSSSFFVGAGQINLPLTFRFFENSEVSLYRRDPITGVSVLQVQGIDYTLSGAGEPEVNGNATGVITLTSALAVGTTAFAERTLPVEQNTDFVNQGRFFPEVHETAFDYLTMLVQQINANTTGAIRVSIGEPEVPRLPPPPQRADMLLGFDSLGLPIPLVPAGGSAAELATLLANFLDPSKGAAMIGRGAQVVDSIAQLKTLLKTTPSKRAFVTGYYAAMDGGGGHYVLDAADTTSLDNGGSIIMAADGGRWKLLDNGIYDVKQFGARADWNGTTGTNNSPLIQACINAARQLRKDVYLSPGDYKLLTGLQIDNSSSTSYIDPKKINFSGAGIHLSRLIFLGNVGACLSVLGGNTAGTLPMQCFQRIHGFDMLGTLAPGTYGLNLDTTQEILIDNVAANSFDWNLNILDGDFIGFHKCSFHWGNHGAIGQERFPRATNSTRPNAITFTDCRIAGNGIYGAHFLGGACVNFYGGHIEGNGQLSSGNGWGVRSEGAGVQGGVGLNLHGVYFEANAGVADTWLVALDPPLAGLNPYHCVQNIQGCSYNRVSNSIFTTHNIVVSFNRANAGKQKANILGNGFKGYGAYVPDAGRSYIHFANDPRGAGNSWIEGNIQQDDIESVPQNDHYNVSLGLSASQSVATATATDILWTGENYDADDMHSTNSALVVIPVTGKYQITGAVYWQVGGGAVRKLQLIRNGSTEIAGDTRSAVSGERTLHTISREYLLTKGDTLSLRCFQDSGGNLTADADGTSLTVRSLAY